MPDTATAAATQQADTTTLVSTATQATQQQDSTTQAADQRPEYIPEKFWRDGKPDVENLGKSYLSLESRQGRLSNAVFVPDEKATPEERAAYLSKIGALSTVEEYAKIKPENLPEGVEWNDDLAKPLYELAHKHNIPAAAIKEYLDFRVKQEAARNDAINGELNKQLEEGTKILQRDWGSNYGANIKRVEQAAKMVGVDPTTAPGFRDPETLKAILRLSEKLSDDTWSKETAGMQSPGGAAKDIMTNPANPSYQKYQNGDPDTVAHVRSLLAQETK